MKQLFRFCIIAASFVTVGAEGDVLWRIGVSDHADTEFALAPNGFQHFQDDGLFVVGQSDPKRDWPYVQPGPADAWAGRRQHTFTVFFALQNVPALGKCSLELDALNAQQGNPPTLRVEINGASFERALVGGAGDQSIRGEGTATKPQSLIFSFPANLLHPGENNVHITTLKGSWFLYDSVALNTPAGVTLAAARPQTIIDSVRPMPALREQDGKLVEPVAVNIAQLAGEADASLQFDGETPLPIHLHSGLQAVEVSTAAVDHPESRNLILNIGGQTIATQAVELKPVRRLVVYVLPHSHNDIGYTEAQSAVEKKQMNNLLEGIAAARRTANYPEGARFVWNLEVLWAADLFLHRMSDERRADFFQAVKSGQVALNGMYANELTGLCRPEELLHLFRYSTELEQQCGVTIDSAMISDVPGATWGTVTAMAQAGIKYLSAAPNWFDRIGDILVNCEDRPFYWTARSGRDKVLVWVPFKGYALSHIYQKLSPEFVAEYQEHLDSLQYPYDISYLRWSGHGDNAVPDPAICDFIKEWNAKYVYPRFIISSTSEAFHAFEQRYGDKLPVRRGDWTPYWEDGAGSSALETAMNRASAERLTQAEKLWSMLDPKDYPASAFDDAWRNVLLYSEHTWGAANSVHDPESQKTIDLWETKRSYARDADAQSRELLDKAFAPATQKSPEIDVFNTASWPRSDLAIAPAHVASAGDRVTDEQGNGIPSQRFADGRLAILTRDIPPFAAQRYQVRSGAAVKPATPAATAKGVRLDNGLLRVTLDKRDGGIIDFRAKGVPGNLVDRSMGESLNEYLFLPGDNLANLQGCDPVTIRVGESGPLVASLVVESGAPGCRRLTREIRLVAGSDRVELIDTVDKAPSPLNPNPNDKVFAHTKGKESVNFAFPFHVPDGQVRLDIPLSMEEPEVDQIPGACKNWFPVNRWADVSNAKFGVTWITLDAPLVEVGGITANLLGSQRDPAAWRKRVDPTQKLYSWAMNNHWHTNYRASQDGPVVFRYFLEPHGPFDPAAAARSAISLAQPLIVRPAAGAASNTPRVQLSSEDVIVVTLKPSDDGKAWIVRLFGAAGKDARVNLAWNHPRPSELWLSDTSERPLQKVDGPVPVPAWELVTLRAQW